MRVKLFYDKTVRKTGTIQKSREAQLWVSRLYDLCRIFAISDRRALGAYLALADLGIRVPEEVRIIGYGGVSVANRAVLNITSIQQDIEQIARHTCDLLLR